MISPAHVLPVKSFESNSLVKRTQFVCLCLYMNSSMHNTDNKAL